MIENSDKERPTLIVYVDREDAEALADRIDEFPLASPVLILNRNNT